MNIVFANNQALIADTTTTYVTTDPMPLDDDTLNKVQGYVRVHRLFGMGASTGFQLDIELEGSNDGQTWISEVAVSPAITTESDAQFSGEFLWAYARLKMSLVATTADWCAGIIDVHCNFVAT